MLTRRTNVLFSEEEYQTLSKLSKKKGKTMGELVRSAVKMHYKTNKTNRKKTTKRIMNEMKQLVRTVNTKGIDYKILINEGRKY